MTFQEFGFRCFHVAGSDHDIANDSAILRLDPEDKTAVRKTDL